jgi:hypothetical protein
MTILKSILAVAGGIVTFSLALLSMMAVGNALLGADTEWINRSVVTHLAWLVWNIVSMSGAGYLSAWIAPKSPVAHAVVMGTIQTVFTTTAMATVTDDTTPRWLWMCGIVLTIPAAWLGARARARSVVSG